MRPRQTVACLGLRQRMVLETYYETRQKNRQKQLAAKIYRKALILRFPKSREIMASHPMRVWASLKSHCDRHRQCHRRQITTREKRADWIVFENPWSPMLTMVSLWRSGMEKREIILQWHREVLLQEVYLMMARIHHHPWHLNRQELLRAPQVVPHRVTNMHRSPYPIMNDITIRQAKLLLRLCSRIALVPRRERKPHLLGRRGIVLDPSQA